MDASRSAFWSRSAADVLQELSVTRDGLTSDEAASRAARRPKDKHDHGQVSDLRRLWDQFKSPITLLLLFSAGLSFFLNDTTDATIIMTIVVISGVLGFWQERGAATAVAKLLSLVAVRSRVQRDGKWADLTASEVVPGDIVELSAGASIPADCLLLDAQELYLDEAALTGETFPVEKTPGELPDATPLSKRANTLYLGTHVVSGAGLAVVVAVGRDTELGRISEHLRRRAPETEFERGVRRFGYLLMEITLLLVIAIFAINVYLGRPTMESFMFALALAVGLTPQLLPAIISVNLAHGARHMADHGVIVKRLASIENLGSMDVLCSDKTGTLTEGKIELSQAVDSAGAKSDKALRCAYLNASFETGYSNPIDDAIRALSGFDTNGYSKLGEIPYDFLRKRLSVMVAKDDRRTLLTKGAFASVLSICSRVETAGGEFIDLDGNRAEIEASIATWSQSGHRVLAVAEKDMGRADGVTRGDERNMTLVGFLLLRDLLRRDIVTTVGELGRLGVRLKVITGDNPLVAAAIAREIGWNAPSILTGTELARMSDEALGRRALQVDVFAEVEPNQKERVILALRKAGRVVGYMGDGVNDAPALHAADVSVSVNSAVDVAKEAADIVLLNPGLDVLIHGVREGRRTFVNTLKYVYMATSANFGNMFSMAGASLFLPFLPLLPKQVLLTNLATDFPEMAIASDSVDPEAVERPRRWDIESIRRFMLVFGVLSSLFDFLTFGVLTLLLRANANQFRTGWFVESVISASLAVLTIRSRRPFFQSQPGSLLQAATLLVVTMTLLLPYSPLAKPLGFIPLPLSFVIAMLGIVAAYLLSAEITKHFYWRSVRD